MNFDFESDLKNVLHTEFDGYGFRLPIRQKINDCLVDYLSIRKKLIFPRPRTVSICPPLLHDLPTHLKKKEIKFLESLFTEGRDANFFQSQRLFQSNFHDHLAYEWNIHHLHLSLEKEKKDNFYKQVKQLLFVFVNDARAIFLGTDNHSNGVFGDIKWQEALHDHFPEIIAEFRDKRIVETYPKLNSAERQTLWDKGYSLPMTDIRGSVYHNPGMGRATSRHNLLVVRQTDEIMRWLFTVTGQFSKFYNSICEYLHTDPQKAKFKLRFGSKTFEIIELKSRQIVLTFPEQINENLFIPFQDQ